MTDPTIPQTILFSDLFDKPLVATGNRRASMATQCRSRQPSASMGWSSGPDDGENLGCGDGAVVVEVSGHAGLHGRATDHGDDDANYSL